MTTTAEVSAEKSGIRKTGARILIVDDDQDTAELYQYLLAQQGFDAFVATSVESALDAAQKDEFDIVMSDMNLPDGDGCDLFEKLNLRRKIRGIAVTGLTGDDSKRRCAAAGFRQMFVKPADIQLVLDAVRELVDEVETEARRG